MTQCSQTGFVTVDDFITLYTPSYVFYSHGCNKFLHARMFITLADTTSIQMHVRLLFPWVRYQSLKPVLSKYSQTSFVTVDNFIALYTPSYVFYSHVCNKFLHARTIAQILTGITKVWPVLIEPWSQIITPCYGDCTMTISSFW